ncbi:MAG TPA: 2-hydroxyacid dehydrogenase [Candidatus Limnocylindrales bacterium]|nr:2-hydroxyacid dehydrogenase [Candidatus Limnocylindrales bacterium]
MTDAPKPTTSDHIVVCLPDIPELAHLGRLPKSVEVRLASPPGPVPNLAEVDLVVPTTSMRSTVLEALERPGRLRVIQTLTAGVDWLIGHVPEGVIVCNARGVFDAPLAEWVVGAILGMQRGLFRARDAQAAREWRYDEPPELAGRRVVILGLGSIGAAIADRLRPFGVDIVGVARSAREDVHDLADLDVLLPGADILVNILPLTSATIGLIGERQLALLPDGALVVNAGRGRTIVTDALVEELQTGRLRAALDVTDPEPLPGDHPLWALPDVLITPHMGGDSTDTLRRAVELAGDQIRRFAAGEPLINQVARYLLD